MNSNATQSTPQRLNHASLDSRYVVRQHHSRKQSRTICLVPSHPACVFPTRHSKEPFHPLFTGPALLRRSITILAAPSWHHHHHFHVHPGEQIEERVWEMLRQPSIPNITHHLETDPILEYGTPNYNDLPSFGPLISEKPRTVIRPGTTITLHEERKGGIST
jgi:hypothetical protein